MSKSYSKTRVLVECALMIAIGTVLSNIKIFTMPNGGSVTLLSMLPFVLVSFRHGVKWGLFTGLVIAGRQFRIAECVFISQKGRRSEEHTSELQSRE